jgi:hypothetical protein
VSVGLLAASRAWGRSGRGGSRRLFLLAAVALQARCGYSEPSECQCAVASEDLSLSLMQGREPPADAIGEFVKTALGTLHVENIPLPKGRPFEHSSPLNVGSSTSLYSVSVSTSQADEGGWNMSLEAVIPSTGDIAIMAPAKRVAFSAHIEDGVVDSVSVFVDHLVGDVVADANDPLFQNGNKIRRGARFVILPDGFRFSEISASVERVNGVPAVRSDIIPLGAIVPSSCWSTPSLQVAMSLLLSLAEEES